MKTFKKALVALICSVFFLPFSFSQEVRAITAAELQAQINTLIAQLNTLQALMAQMQETSPTDNWCYNFNKNLYKGSKGDDVLGLNMALIKEGLYAGQENNVFGTQMQQAVVRLQKKYAIQPANGYAGPLTRAKLNVLYGCQTTPTGQNATADVSFVSATTVVSSCGPMCDTATGTFVFKVKPHGGTLKKLGIGTGGGGAQGTITISPYDQNGIIRVDSAFHTLSQQISFLRTDGNIPDGVEEEITITQTATERSSGGAGNIRFKVNSIFWEIGNSSKSESSENWVSPWVYLTNTPQENFRFIRLLSPNGGEIWEPGKTYDITWTSSGVQKVMIEITKEVYGGSVGNHLVYDLPASTGKWSYQLLGFPAMGLGYKIHIWSVDPGQSSIVEDYSDNTFGISAPGGTNHCTNYGDAGKNYYVYGYNTSRFNYTSGAVESKDYLESCNGRVLTEYWCGTGGSLMKEEYTCPEGCQNGACIGAYGTTATQSQLANFYQILSNLAQQVKNLGQ